MKINFHDVVVSENSLWVAYKIQVKIFVVYRNNKIKKRGIIAQRVGQHGIFLPSNRAVVVVQHARGLENFIQEKRQTCVWFMRLTYKHIPTNV